MYGNGRDERSCLCAQGDEPYGSSNPTGLEIIAAQNKQPNELDSNIRNKHIFCVGLVVGNFYSDVAICCQTSWKSQGSWIKLWNQLDSYDCAPLHLTKIEPF